MLEELEVLRIVSERLEIAQLPFMLTGSFAMAYYGRPRMTRDLDIVVALGEDDVSGLVAALSPDFYVDADSVRSAVASQRLFNLMHLATSIKVDLIVRKGSEYRQVEFARRRPVELSGVKTWIVSREDLILSKLVWGKDSGSELQRRDVRTLLDDSMDRAYLDGWAARLGVAETLAEIAQ
ncbi:MAG TPA: hypothetical protein VH814_02985 [Steroidobacteraceae bacterium]|jgi:hypothetical protein